MINYSNYKVALEKHRHLKCKYKWSSCLLGLMTTTINYKENTTNRLLYIESKKEINKWYETQKIYKQIIKLIKKDKSLYNYLKRYWKLIEHDDPFEIK